MTERWLWTQKQDIGPSPRVQHEMAYDAARQRVVLFGGQTDISLNDTWEWDGRVWTQRQNMGPKARDNPALAYDSQRDRVVLFGGLNREGGVPNLLDDTWELAIVEQPPA